MEHIAKLSKFRRGNFWTSFLYFLNHSEYLQWWSERKWLLKDFIEEDVSYRAINYWSEMGLIDDSRTDTSKWRKFSLSEMIWINILKEIKKFGMPNDVLLKVKTNLIDYRIIESDKNKFPLFEYYLTLAYFSKRKVYLMISANGDTEIATDDEFDLGKNLGTIEQSFILLDINHVLNDFFVDENLGANKNYKSNVSEEEAMIINAIREKNSSKILIVMNNGQIKKIKSTELIKTKKSYTDLMNEYSSQSVTYNKNHNQMTIVRTKNLYQKKPS